MVGLELHTVGPHSGTNPCPPPSCGHLVGLLTVCRVHVARLLRTDANELEPVVVDLGIIRTDGSTCL